MSERDRRMIAAVLLSACGDAMGIPVDEHSAAAIRNRFGQAGSTAPPRPGRISAVSQLLITTIDGLIRSGVHGTDAVSEVGSAIRRWAATQRAGGERAGGEGEPATAEGLGWLAGVPQLRVRRAGVADLARRIEAFDGDPGTASRQLALPMTAGTRPDPTALIRGVAAGILLPAMTAQWVAATSTRQLGGDVLSAWSAAALAHGVALACAGEPLPTALRRAVAVQPTVHPDHRRGASTIQGAVTLAERFPGSAHLCQRLARDRRGESTLSIAIYAACSAETAGPGWALWLGTNHAGASALAGAITGALLGAQDGVAALNPRWLQRLELRFTLAQLLNDACVVCRGEAASVQGLAEAYPASPG